MAWTYGADPDANDRDEVRFLCGDVDTNDQLLNDAEIAYLISVAGNNTSAASLACDAIAAQFARDVDVKNGPAQEWASQRYQQYKDKAAELKRRANALVKPRFGGQSISDKETMNDNTDVPQPYFYRGRTDAVGSPSHVDGGDDDERDDY